MATLTEAFAIAVHNYRSGRLDPAAQLCRRILQSAPEHVDTLNLLGVITHLSGRDADAAELLDRAVELAPSNAHCHSNLGLALSGLGRFEEAAASFRRALDLEPHLAGALSNLGQTLSRQGNLDEAIACYRRALQTHPDFAEAWAHLGEALRLQGKPEEAETCCRRAVRFDPRLPQSHHYLANVLRGQGRIDEALPCYHRALQLRPDVAAIHNDLARALIAGHNLDDATAACRQALKLEPDLPEAWVTLGDCLRARRQFREAAPCYQRALQLRPDQPGVHNNLANTFHDLGMPDEAIANYHQALQLKPDYAEAYNNLAAALHDLGRFDEAIASYQRAIELQPTAANIHSAMLGVLSYSEHATLKGLAELHAAFERQHGAHLRALWPAHHNPPDPRRRLRVGFVSADLTNHPVGYFLIPVLEHLDANEVHTFCYFARPGKDAMTARFQAATDTWRDVAWLSDQELAAQIRTDQIDILFDLSGHSVGNRLLAFARKPAPIQITWMGYVGTTGLAAMDYLLADRYEIPAGAEPYYGEKVLRMPDGYVCFEPPTEAPAVGPLPALTQDRVTFGCFNNPAKITPAVVRVWAEILRRVPHSVLALLPLEATMPAAHRLQEQLAAHDIAAERLQFWGRASRAELLARYNRVDLALDPFPYGGGLTTCEALWMGVPVITCPGETFSSRHALSHLSNVGCTETIAADFPHYVELAVTLAHDLPQLAGIRSRLRGQMAASPLCDGRRFAQHWTAVLRQVWHAWCQSPCPC
jgi:predicted O-linked N-acetylglucosamine transferase (SPINDLY family)